MSSRWRRFEVLLPLQFNDGRDVPEEWLADAVLEIVAQFGAASYETQRIEGHWRHDATHYRDTLVRLVVDVPESAANRKWMRSFKDRWRVKLRRSTFGWSATSSASSEAGLHSWRLPRSPRSGARNQGYRR